MNLIPHAESRGRALSKTSRGLTAIRATEPVLCSMREFGGQSGGKVKVVLLVYDRQNKAECVRS